MTFFCQPLIAVSQAMTYNLWTIIKDKTRNVVVENGDQEDRIVSFEKIPDSDFLEDIEVGALLNE